MLRQLHVVVAGAAVRTHTRRATAHGGRCQSVLGAAHRCRATAAAARHRREPALVVTTAPAVRDRRGPAVGELGAGAAAHLPHHRALRRRRLHYHHDAAAGGVYPPIVPRVRAPAVVRGRAGRVRGVRGDIPARVLPPAPAPPPRRQHLAPRRRRQDDARAARESSVGRELQADTQGAICS